MEEKLTQVGVESIKQISLTDPAIAILLTILIGAVAFLIWFVLKLQKKVDDKNEKLYQDAKADFKLVLAFEKKLDDLVENESIKTKDMTELKLMIRDVRDVLFRNKIPGSI